MKNIQQTISELKEQISALPMTIHGKRQGMTDDLRKTIVHLNQECDIGAEELLNCSSSVSGWSNSLPGGIPTHRVHAPSRAHTTLSKSLDLEVQLSEERHGAELTQN